MARPNRSWGSIPPVERRRAPAHQSFRPFEPQALRRRPAGRSVRIEDVVSGGGRFVVAGLASTSAWATRYRDSGMVGSIQRFRSFSCSGP